MLSEPSTKSGRFKRRVAEALEEISGKKYCTSCRQSKPREQVKIYRTRSGVGMPRCDACQERRLTHMKGRK